MEQFSDQKTKIKKETLQYFDIQAEIGQTKHLGGAGATRQLLERCQIGPDKHLLYVGCGAGASVIYILKTYGPQITAVDVHPKMVETARALAERLGVADQIEFREADAQDLPFEDDTFDILICESVNTFVPDLAQAAREYVRVVKPGGYVGLNEAIWVKEPPADLETTMMELLENEVRESQVWEDMLAGAGLVNLQFSRHEIDMRQEAGNQYQLLGLGEYLRILGRFLGGLLGNAETRGFYRRAFNFASRDYIDRMGYGLYVGQKPGG